MCEGWPWQGLLLGCGFVDGVGQYLIPPPSSDVLLELLFGYAHEKPGGKGAC